jgi:hypothetical protein
MLDAKKVRAPPLSKQGSRNAEHPMATKETQQLPNRLITALDLLRHAVAVHDHDLTVAGFAHTDCHVLTTVAMDNPNAIVVFADADTRAFVFMYADADATNANRNVVRKGRSRNRDTSRRYQSKCESSHSKSSMWPHSIQHGWFDRCSFLKPVGCAGPATLMKLQLAEHRFRLLRGSSKYDVVLLVRLCLQNPTGFALKAGVARAHGSP